MSPVSQTKAKQRGMGLFRLEQFPRICWSWVSVVFPPLMVKDRVGEWKLILDLRLGETSTRRAQHRKLSSSSPLTAVWSWRHSRTLMCHWLCHHSLSRNSHASGRLQLTVQSLVQQLAIAPECLTLQFTHTSKLALIHHSLLRHTDRHTYRHIDTKRTHSRMQSSRTNMHTNTVYRNTHTPDIKSNQILFVTYTWLADVNASVAKWLCF